MPGYDDLVAIQAGRLEDKDNPVPLPLFMVFCLPVSFRAGGNYSMVHPEVWKKIGNKCEILRTKEKKGGSASKRGCS